MPHPHHSQSNARQNPPQETPGAGMIEYVVVTDDHPPSATPLPLHTRSDVVIILTWLMRLRWCAVAGQTLAILIAEAALGFELPLAWLIGIMSVTAGTNIALALVLRRRDALPPQAVSGLLLVDMVLLTALLAATGGPENPFCAIYLTHVAMAVTVLRERTTWLIVGAALACYLSLFGMHHSLQAPEPLPQAVFDVGAWIALAITAASIAYFVGKLRSALRARELELADMRDRVIHGEKLAGLATLAAGAAHELGTPLGTIALAAHELQRLREDEGVSARVAEDVKLIRNEVGRCRRILDRMHIEDARQADEEPVNVSVDALLDELRHELRLGEADRLKCRVQPGIEAVTIRRQALLQVLGILVHNACDASEDADSPVTMDIASDNKSLQFTISDRGHGMTREQIERIGEPFVTTKDPHRGMGLGLFLARLILQHVGGRLAIRSAPGQGTVAVLNFPGQHDE
jgi:two-component system sensor histidine kinase RegB